MKNVFRILFTVISFVFLLSCSGGGNPEAVSEKFLNHLSKQEWSAAKKLMTTETAPMMTMIEGMASMSENSNMEMPSEFEVIGCEIDGENAVCTYVADGNTEKLKLKKQDGEWKVALTKE